MLQGSTVSASRRVLVADADADTRTLYRYAFEGIDSYVIEASDGHEALTKAFVHPPALLVTELWLPLLDGYDLCKILRQDPTTSEVPILVVTSEARPGELDRARQAGASAVLVKPTLTQTLVIEARQLLTRSHDLRERSAAATERAAAHLARSEILLARSQKHQMLRRTHPRFPTTTPPRPPPALKCPSCDGSLTYEQSYIGVNERSTEQWDVFACPAGCGTFEYRQRTRRVRRIN